MIGANPTWLRRHRLAVFVSVAATIVLAGSYALVSAVQRARTAASRSADL
jgi:hypothetical protein